MKKMISILALTAMTLWAARIKDVAYLDGASNMQVVGYGLVVGLAGTGDGNSTQFTVRSVANMLQKLGVEVPADKMRLRNVAAVMVTAEVAPFIKNGRKIDVNIASLGDARSLEGGTLLMTPLQGTDGEVYAVAQGAVSIGGGVASDSRNRARVRKNHALSGTMPDGGIVQREVLTQTVGDGYMRWVLAHPDFSSAVSMAQAINEVYPSAAQAEDAGSVRVNLALVKDDIMNMIARTENLEFTTSTVARVVLNERTGTLVAGTDVRISEVAVSHSNVMIQIDAQTQVSQPNAFSAGRTTSVLQEQVAMQGADATPEYKVLPGITNAGQLAQALNSLGVAPRDIVSIFQAIKRAGALQAELVII
ncbi:MAG: flagellar basal body P-ring protein FlgI [Fibrobacter sp.]|nr:flagellar basal body P-ring protein FlgI [Fibrobacter sp.]